MNCFRTFSKGLIVLVGLLFATSCHKEVPSQSTQTLDNFDHRLATEWYGLSVDLIGKCSGFSEPIAARSLNYMAFTLYEGLVPGMQGLQSLQNKLDGFQLSLPSGEEGKAYNYALVTNQALSVMARNLYGSSGSQNLVRVDELQKKFEAEFSANESAEVKENSKILGNAIGFAIYKFSMTDGQGEAFLNNFPIGFKVPVGESSWIPTPPDYIQKPMLPYWGQVRPVMFDNVTDIYVPSKLVYSNSPNSNMYAEALEAYNMNQHLSADQKETLTYWNRYNHYHANPLCHNAMLMMQLIKESNKSLPETIEMLARFSYAMHDAYILSWKIKYEKNLLRPSSYIKTNISRFFIPEVPALPVPEYVSESAVIYSAASQLLSHYFGFRYAFTDKTQSDRTDINVKTREYNSFDALAKEAAYSDILGAVQFRSSIDAGYEVGYDLAQNVLEIPMKK